MPVVSSAPVATAASAAAPDPRHFARAVTELGEKRRVVASSAIFNHQGVKIIDKGVVIDARLYERLTQHQLKTPLAQSVESEPGVTGAQLRTQAEQVLAREPFFGRMGEPARTRDLLLDTLENMPIPAAIGFQLTLLRETRSDLWQHSVRSAWTAAWLGSRMGPSRYDIGMLAAAGLLHDIGMLHLDPVLLQPEIALTRAQRRQLYSHPLVSVMLLERHHEYPRDLLRAVLEHHETLDATGYPRNVDGPAISPWGRVLSITEVITAMFAPERLAPELRLSVALRMNRQRYDEHLVAHVMPLLHADAAHGMPAAADPPAELREIDRLLAAWPSVVATAGAAATAAQKNAFEALHEQCAQVQRSMAGAGASAEQLALLGDEWRTGTLAQELTLILHEAAWMLRSMSRQVRRRWRDTDAQPHPPVLQQWLTETDALCARHLSR